LRDASADTRSDISRQWIKAHLLGGIVFAITPAVGDLIIRWIGVSAGHVGTVDMLVLGIVLVSVNSLSLALFGYLIGVVLRQKLPLFPLHAWLMLFALAGLVIGLLAAAAWLEEVSDLDKMGLSDLTALVVGIVVAGFVGMLIGAIAGVLQALVLSKVAEGLRAWILFSSLAGIPMVAVMVPMLVYGMQPGFVREALDAVAGFFATVVGAFIMLPALHRLRPR
jgi:hypothetical protein